MTVDEFRTLLREDLVAYLPDRDRAGPAVVRTLAAALENAEAVESDHGTGDASRRHLTHSDAIEIVDRELSDRISVVAEYARHPDADHARRLHAEIDVLQRYRDVLTSG
jgi:uncharacterized protein YqeY